MQKNLVKQYNFLCIIKILPSHKLLHLKFHLASLTSCPPYRIFLLLTDLLNFQHNYSVVNIYQVPTQFRSSSAHKTFQQHLFFNLLLRYINCKFTDDHNAFSPRFQQDRYKTNNLGTCCVSVSHRGFSTVFVTRQLPQW